MASMVPWSPLQEMREALDELMDENIQWQAQPAGGLPSANVYQTARDIVVELQLPGYMKEELSIEVGEEFVTVSGQSARATETRDRQYVRREFAMNSFSRTVALPSIVQPSSAEAEMKHGILTIAIPKLIEEKPKTAKISIKSGE